MLPPLEPLLEPLLVPVLVPPLVPVLVPPLVPVLVPPLLPIEVIGGLPQPQAGQTPPLLPPLLVTMTVVVELEWLQALNIVRAATVAPSEMIDFVEILFFILINS